MLRYNVFVFVEFFLNRLLCNRVCDIVFFEMFERIGCIILKFIKNKKIKWFFFIINVLNRINLVK